MTTPGTHGAARAAALAWIDGDLEPADQAELWRIVEAADAGDDGAAGELADRTSGPLRFGTAGLRAALRAGPNGMNRATVVRTSAGVAAWLAARGGADGTVLVGCDARHGSERFRDDTAAVFAAAGLAVCALDGPQPTPVLAHATRALGAVAGVQITASHNPPEDNGYKLYLAGGVPPVPPVDGEIEDAIAEVGPAASVPRSGNWHVRSTALPEYLTTVARLPRGSARGLRVAATALHGVGAEPLRRALTAAGFAEPHLVPEQAAPDPDFPTVRFPNPEEPGTANALLALAEEVSADLAIALDPDADRCALGVAEFDGTWRMLRGDETGVLLGEHLLSTLDDSAPSDPLVASTIVSSPMLDSIARDHGARHEETLTGFKWLVRAGDGAGTGLVYAYEEALGHCVDPDVVRDKDGISTAVLACDLAATLKARGTGLPDLLDDLFRTHGVHRTDQISVRTRDVSRIDETMRALRAEPPGELAGIPVSARDLAPDADALVLSPGGRPPEPCRSGVRVVVRPSGTEPKLKCYLQVVEPVTSPGSAGPSQRSTTSAPPRDDPAAEDAELASAHRRSRERMERLREEVAALVR